MSKKRIIVAGGGASGLISAISAAQAGASVTILEQNDRPGRKLAATGNGKCNLTNIETHPDDYRGTSPAFVQEAFRQFSVQDTIRFFSELGIYTVNRNGGLYPHSGQAQSVVDVLCMKARSLGVKIKTQEKVLSLERTEERTWKVHTQGWAYEGDAVILANGSRASAISGSDGSGYDLARALGHTMIEPLPALTALKCRGQKFAPWAGVRTDGAVSLYLDDVLFMTERGELQLTDYGISGIPVFQISRYAIRALHEGRKVSVTLDFLPELSETQLANFLKKRQQDSPYKNEKELLIGLFPDKLIRVLTSCKDLSKAIKSFSLTVTDGLSFEHAQVCSGGVATSEVSSQTMESKLAPGIYFAGELLDIDGICGGYNLQWAWSSGYCAGYHAAL